MSSDPELPADADGPVTTTVTRRIKQGHEAAHEAFLAGISGAARAFPGCLGIEIFRPAPGASDEYRTVYRFDSSALRRGCAVLGLFADPRVLKRLLPGR